MFEMNKLLAWHLKYRPPTIVGQTGPAEARARFFPVPGIELVIS